MWNHSKINMPRKLFQGAYSSMRKGLYVCIKLGSFGRQWSLYLKWHNWNTFREISFRNAPWTRSRKGLAGGIVGPGYSSNGCYQHSLCASGAQIGLDILTGGHNWPSWGSDEFWCFMGASTDLAGWVGQFEEVLIFHTTHSFLSFTGGPTDLLDYQLPTFSILRKHV